MHTDFLTDPAALNTAPMSPALLLAPGENLLDSPSNRASLKMVQQQSPWTSSDVSFLEILEGETVRSSMSSVTVMLRPRRYVLSCRLMEPSHVEGIDEEIEADSSVP